MAIIRGDPDEGIGLAARIVLHLAKLKRLGPNDVALLVYTQQGMVTALHVPQGSVVRALQPLLAAYVVAAEKRFVTDANRRMKVYVLTALGETAARHLQHPKTESPRTWRESGWIASENTPGWSHPKTNPPGEF